MKRINELVNMPVSYGENYTELVTGGEGITVEKGVISTSGGSGGIFTMSGVLNDFGDEYNLDKTFTEVLEHFNNKNLCVAFIPDYGLMLILTRITTTPSKSAYFITTPIGSSSPVQYKAVPSGATDILNILLSE